MHIPVLFIWFLIFALVFYYNIKKTTKKDNAAKEAFWQKEQTSLSVRKKEFEPSDYIKPDMSRLSMVTPPSMDPGDRMHLEQLRQRLHSLESLDMMNFAHLSNTEIRIRFGTANQTIITTNEQHLHVFLKTLAEYGMFMSRHNEKDEAIAAFELAIDLGSDYSNHYVELAKLYASEQNSKAIERLMDKAHHVQTLNQSLILNKLSTFQK